MGRLSGLCSEARELGWGVLVTGRKGGEWMERTVNAMAVDVVVVGSRWMAWDGMGYL